jgi:uncharacterized protein (DUF302 family)
MRTLLCAIAALFFLAPIAFADNGVISVSSSHDVKTTADRLVQSLTTKGMTVFTRIDHAAGAAKVGKTLRPTELVIFGNPKVGTPLMMCDQGSAIDLPQKALIWEDGGGQAWLSYNDPKYLAQRHDLSKCAEVVKKIDKALGNFAAMATQP